MAAPIDEVSPGQPLQFTAADWNRVRRLAMNPPGKQLNTTIKDTFIPACQIRVWNDDTEESTPYPAFGVVGLPNHAIDPNVENARLQSVRAPVALAGSPTETGPFGIVMLPIPGQRVGYCTVAGVTVAAVQIVNVDHEWAKPIADDNTKLISSDSGPVRLISRFDSTASYTYAIVQVIGVENSGDGNTGSGTLCPQLMTRVCLNNSAIMALTGGSSISDIVTALQALTLELEYTDCATGEKTCETSDDNCCDTPYALACCPPGNGFTFPDPLYANFTNKTGYAVDYPNTVVFGAWTPYGSGYIAEALFSHSVDTPSNGITVYAVVFCDPDNSDLPTVSFSVSSSLVMTRDAVGATYSAGGPYIDETAVKKAYACGGTYAPGAGVTVAEYSTSNGVDASNDGTFDLVISE